MEDRKGLTRFDGKVYRLAYRATRRRRRTHDRILCDLRCGRNVLRIVGLVNSILAPTRHVRASMCLFAVWNCAHLCLSVFPRVSLDDARTCTRCAGRYVPTVYVRTYVETYVGTYVETYIQLYRVIGVYRQTIQATPTGLGLGVYIRARSCAHNRNG